MKTSGTNRKLRVLLTGIKNGSLVPRPEFQRRLVWSSKDKISFIETVLMGYPFPEIYIAAGDVDPDTGEGTELLVDGQQRITTLYQYFTADPELKLPKGFRTYQDLSKDEKIEFLEYDVVARDLGKKSIEQIKEIFQRINSTKYSLNAMEIHNARFDGDFKKFCEDLSQHPFFEKNKVFSTNEIRRMKDVVFCLTITISIMSTYFNRDNELELFLEKYNDEFEDKEEVNKQISEVMELINKLGFESKSRSWKKADLLTLFVEIHRAIFKNNLNFNTEKLGKQIKKFYQDIDSGNLNSEEHVTYQKYTSSATNDRSSRIARGKIIQEIIEQCS